MIASCGHGERLVYRSDLGSLTNHAPAGQVYPSLAGPGGPTPTLGGWLVPWLWPTRSPSRQRFSLILMKARGSESLGPFTPDTRRLHDIHGEQIEFQISAPVAAPQGTHRPPPPTPTYEARPTFRVP